MTRIEFRPIDKPWMYGETASVGDRVAEVVLAYTDGGLWRIFCFVAGCPVKFRREVDPEFVSYRAGMKQAREFLRSRAPVECQPVVTYSS